MGEQALPDCHYATASKKWSKHVNIVIMECYYKSKPLNENGVPIRGYWKRKYRVGHRVFQSCRIENMRPSWSD